MSQEKNIKNERVRRASRQLEREEKHQERQKGHFWKKIRQENIHHRMKNRKKNKEGNYQESVNAFF